MAEESSEEDESWNENSDSDDELLQLEQPRGRLTSFSAIEEDDSGEEQGEASEEASEETSEEEQDPTEDPGDLFEGMSWFTSGFYESFTESRGVRPEKKGSGGKTQGSA